MLLAPAASRAETLTSAALRFADGRFDEVKALCLTQLQRDPTASDRDNCAVLRQLAMAHLLTHEFVAALSLLERIAPLLPDDGKLHLAMAEAVWASRSAQDALAHFQAAKRLLPGDFSVRERFGLALLMAGDAEAAKAELEAAIELQPASVAALTHLGLAQSMTGAVERAIPYFEAALEIDPESIDALFQLGTALRAGGHTTRAISVFRGAVIRSPGSALLRVALGDALMAAGDPVDAVSDFLAATRVQPGWAVGWMALAGGLQLIGDRAAAISAYRAALLLDPTQAQAHALLGNILFEAGAVDCAYRHYTMSMQGAPWVQADAERAAMTVAVLAAPGSANTPTRFILDPAALSAHIFYVLPGADHLAAKLSGSVDLIFNAVSDPDTAAAEFGDLTRLAAGLDKPVLNPPALIERTRRDRMADFLADIEGCVAPQTLRCAAGAIDAASAFAREVGYPVLLRPVGSHGGEGLMKVDGADELDAALAAYGDFYITKFHETRSADGWYRKYRLIIVDGEILPYHLAIHDDWLVHYFRAPMAETDVFRAEEALFLEAPEHMLGAVAFAALGRIAAAVELDFFGIDCTVDETGRLLVFECNATMLVRDGGDPTIMEAKQIAAARIRDAVTAMVQRRLAI